MTKEINLWMVLPLGTNAYKKSKFRVQTIRKYIQKKQYVLIVC